MPSYDFRCRACGHQFTVKVAVEERDAVRCPVCGSQELSQLFTTVNYYRPGSCGAPAGGGLRFG